MSSASSDEAVPAPEEPPLLRPAGDAASSAAAAPATPAVPILFHGDAWEYFRIWIANVLLTMLTLGVFAAWAKVRRRRYFRGNIELLGHRFDYTARPLRLLIGNLIVVVLFLGYALFGAVYPAVRLLALAVGACLLPWIIVRSFGFNAHHTVYRGLRFRFHPSLSAAAVLYLLEPFFIVFSLGFYYPAWAHDQRQFMVERHRFGTAFFRFEAAYEPFYRAYLTATAAVVVVMAAVGFGLAAAHASARVGLTTIVWMVVGAYLPVFYFARQYVHARLFNVVWNATKLDDCRFEATMSAARWLKLELGNWAAIVLSCGLLYPWAAVRSARYTASCLKFFPSPGFMQVRRMGAAQGSALGDTAAEFVGLDFGL